MSWENSVLPVFMAASAKKPRRLPELAIAIQIDTTIYPLEPTVSHGFQRFNPSFNRTRVTHYVKQHIFNLIPGSFLRTLKRWRANGKPLTAWQRPSIEKDAIFTSLLSDKVLRGETMPMSH